MFSRNYFISLLILVMALATFINATPMSPDGTLDEYEELQRKMLVCKTGGGYTGSKNYQLRLELAIIVGAAFEDVMHGVLGSKAC
ncbi:hypothetical protein BDZ45DRAFT_750634 [Acephala macrosclerotiorum]|nr:hypothetical protein BDZ45DRAFT_750634 [Acephala macrosclerotiorum]